MADATEVRWGCGCHEVNGELEVQCTQVPAQGDLSAERHAVAQPYSAKCFRLANLNAAEVLVEQPTVEIPNPAPGEGPSGTFTVTAVDTATSTITLDSAPVADSVTEHTAFDPTSAPEPPLDREKLKALHLEEADRPE